VLEDILPVLTVTSGP